MKKAGIFLIFISLCLIFSGVAVVFFSVNSDATEKENQIISNDEKTGDDPTDAEIEYNTQSSVLEEHCFEGICYTITELSYVYDAGSLMVNMHNDGTVDLPSGYVKFVFTTPSGNVDVLVNHPDLSASNSSMTETLFENESLLQATDYTIVALTAEELQALS